MLKVKILKVLYIGLHTVTYSQLKEIIHITHYRVDCQYQSIILYITKCLMLTSLYLVY